MKILTPRTLRMFTQYKNIVVTKEKKRAKTEEIWAPPLSEISGSSVWIIDEGARNEARVHKII